MKTGFEQRGKLLVAVGLGVVALAALWYALSGTPHAVSGAAPTGPTASQATPTRPRTAAQRRLRDKDRQKAPQERSLDPTLRFDWLSASEGVEYKGGKRNIFSAHVEPPPMPRPKKADAPKCPGPDPRCGPPPPVCPGPDPRCPPPPIPLQFFGFASKPGEPKRIFLRTTDTDDVFVAGQGEVVNRRYRITRIMDSSVEVEDVLNNNKQVLPLTQG